MFFSKRQKGQGLVEFALILPVLLMILLGIIEAAIVFQAFLAVQHAAREAARFAVTMEPPHRQMIDAVGDTVNCDGSADRWGITCYGSETLDDWEDRRVRITQQIATDQAYGLAKDYLAYNWNITGPNPDPEVYLTDGVEPRFFGVLVKGWMGPGDDDFEYWKPGLEGLPIIVTVYYNVKLLDPIYQAIIPGGQVRVVGEASMINEGVTVGLAHLPLPNFEDTPVHDPLTPTHTPTSGVAPTPTHTPTPTSTPGPTPTPTQTPTVTPTPTVPYIVVSEYEDVHAGETLTAWLYQHPTGATYDLWWYTATPSGAGQVVTALLATGITVDANGDSGSVQFTIPNDTEGTYYLVSYESGTTSPEIARSALITVDPLPPDLVVQRITVPPQVDFEGGEPMTVTLEIANLTATGVYDTYFDIDIYVDPSREPSQGFPGYRKQWRSNIGPYGSITATISLTDVVELWSVGEHEVWAQVDTSNRVPDELYETNNISGPVPVDAGCVSSWLDGFAGHDIPPAAEWTTQHINASGNNSAPRVINNQLRVRSRGTSLWGGNNSFTFIYQSVQGDFDARLQVIQPMDYTGNYAKIGLMVRQDTQANSPYIMVMRHSASDETDKIQYAVREDRGANPSESGYQAGNSLPIWVRIVRHDDVFRLYYSTDTTSDAATVSGWQLATSYQVPSDPGDHDFDLDGPLLVGIAAAAYNGGNRQQGYVDNFRLCLIGEGGQPPIPRYGYQTCTQPIQTGLDQPIGGGSFELGWDTYWTHGEEIGASNRDSTYDHTREIHGLGGAYSMQLKAETFGWSAGCGLAVPYHPWLEQSISIPEDAGDFVEMPDSSMEPMIVTIQTEFWHIVEPRATPRPDPFMVTVRDVSGSVPVTLTNVGTFDSPGEALIVLGDEPAGMPWTHFSSDLVSHMAAAGHNIADYAGQDLQLYWFAPNPYDPCDPANIPPSVSAPDLAFTWFYLDDVSVEVCSTWPTPDIDPAMATVGGNLQMSILGSLQDAPGTLVWAYSVDGELSMTYALHDSTYHFYNLPPGTYSIYSEAWADEDLYFTLDTVILPAGETTHNLILK